VKQLTLIAGTAVLAAAALGIGTRQGPLVAAASKRRTVTVVKPMQGARIASSMVVPLGPRNPTQGQLAILNKKGEAAGLCPLKHTDVDADVAGFVARVNVTQQFHNASSEPVEAVYTFPLPSDAAVDDMEMRLGTRVVKGEIKRREEARDIYEAAKAAGQTAALLDQERPNIFTQAVANVMPGQDITIRISYVNLLKYEDGKYEFAFPMVVGPRYTPGGGYKTPGQRGDPSDQKVITTAPGATSVVTDADKITPPITPPGTRAGHDVSVTVNIDAGMPIGDIQSVLHEVNAEGDGNRARITLKDQAVIPNKDFILRWNVQGNQVQTGVIASAPRDGEGYFTLILQPPAAPPQNQLSKKEIVFVLDQTGSQMGQPIAKSKEAMKYAIQHLNAGDTFQLIGFNTSVFPCFPAAVPATPANIQKAIAYMEPLQGAGGTDILAAANYALKMPADPGRLRIICFMTDGYVGNDMQIIDFVKNNRGAARMFPFGIGSSVNRFLIDGMATEGRGEADYVTLQEDGAKAAQKFYQRIASPLLLDPHVDWNGLPVEDVYPRNIPDVFSAGPIILKGRYTQAAEGDITVRGLLRGQPWSQTVHVKLPRLRAQGSAIESLWARAKIDDIQANDWIGAQTGNPNPNVKEDIVQVALAHRLMSQYTSFVAVEKQVVNVGGKQRTVDVPVEMPEGVAYEGIFGDTAVDSIATRSAGVTMLYASPMSTPAMGNTMSKARAALPPSAGFGGVAPSAPSGSMSLGVPVQAAAELKVKDGDAFEALSDSELAKLPPEDRKSAVRHMKLAASLQALAETVKREGAAGSLHKKGLPEVEKGRVIVQVSLSSLPADGLAKLKAAGFIVSATLTPKRLLLGDVDLADLDKLIELDFVRRVTPAVMN
jgi:Ca-activated chloride channel family protein